MKIFNRIGFGIKRRKPEIFMVAGFASSIAATVLWIKQTPKALAINEEREQQLETIDKVAADPEAAKKVGYTNIEKDAAKDRKLVNIHAGIKLAKNYILPAGLQAFSFFCFAKSYKTLKGWNLGLAAAVAGISKEFKDYRGRLIERFDEKLDRELMYDIRKEEIEETVVDENGKEKTKKETVDVVHASPSAYTRFFDATSKHWNKDPELNKIFLLGRQKHWNRVLIERGFVFLNEILKDLDLEQSQAGQVLGWRYDLEHPTGDNFIDFGIFDSDSESARRFVNGLENVALLEFNFDGYLLDGSLDGIMTTK